MKTNLVLPVGRSAGSADPVDAARRFAAEAEAYQNTINAYAQSIPPEIANGMRDGMRQVFGHFVNADVDDAVIAAMLGITVELVADRLMRKNNGVAVLIPERDAGVRGVEQYVATLLRNAIRQRSGLKPPEGTA